MAPDDEDIQDVEHEENVEFVTSIVARSPAEAEEYCELLQDHDIPTVIGAPDEDEQLADGGTRGKQITHGVPVLVPETLLDEASEIIADREDAADKLLVDDEDEEFEDEDDEDEYGFSEALETGEMAADLDDEDPFDEPDEHDEQDEDEEDDDLWEDDNHEL
mgnify:CR=1 FL=1